MTLAEPRTSPPRNPPDAALGTLATLRSYDVFDTVVTRIVGSPQAVFQFVGQAAVANGLWLGTPDHFAAARVASESRARQHAAPREVSFAAIYRELARSNNLTPSVRDAIAKHELELERRTLRAVPELGIELTRARRSGEAVTFVSDMYLPHDVLHDWLIDLGVLQDSERLWVSSQHGVTKAGGGLFELVRAAQPSPPRRWVHRGDNVYADVRAPAALGIDAEHWTDCHLNADEAMMESASIETCGLGSLMAGSARWTRLARPAEIDPDLNTVAADIAGPVLYAFVLWVLREASRRGLRRIWFMARDGQVMLPVARTIAARLGLDIELGYLYGGRQVVRVASLTEIDDDALEWMTGAAGVMTVQAVLDRVGVSLAQVSAVAASLGLPEHGPIGWERMPALRRFLQHADVAPLILREAANRRVIVLEYFRACGLLGDESCAVVDIGWKGNVLRAIVQLIGLEQASRHTFLYFGLYAHPKGCSQIPMAGYLFDVADPEQAGTGSDIPSMTTIMEIFCQADHGSVMRIERDAAGFEPVCREPEANSAESRWNVVDFQRAIATFAEALPIGLASAIDADLRGLCDRLLRRLLTAPTANEVSLLAPIGFVDDQGGSAPQPFAHAYGWSQLRDAFRSGETWPKWGLNWWVAGAVALTPKPLRWSMRAAAKAGRLRAQWRRRADPRRNAP